MVTFQEFERRIVSSEGILLGKCLVESNQTVTIIRVANMIELLLREENKLRQMCEPVF